MTEAKVLADALVEAGIGEQEKYPLSCDGVGFYYTPDDESEGMCADLFITDWRVAGKVLESAHMAFIEQINGWSVRYDKAYGCRTREWHSDESLPRAIIEAWYAARETEL